VDGTLSGILPFLDDGLYPFARCHSCGELMPVNINMGPFGTVLVTCCRCKAPAASHLIRFLSAGEATELGWAFEETARAPAN
jgi:hypothetical protein